MDDELFDVVDEGDEVIGVATRRQVHIEGHIHRSVLFFLFDEQGRVFVNQRTAAKDFYPEHWSIVFGGHVHAGETYDQAVVREAKEEAGVESPPFFIDSFHKRFDREDRENVAVFGFVLGQEPELDPEEVQRGYFATLAELERKLRTGPFLPETGVLLPVLRRWLRART
ncbi:MAG: NUDIX domain-containing protein [Bacteroidetes bacterium]|nr:NUDIX domain-containing protein [Bacteroidota bacterium]